MPPQLRLAASLMLSSLAASTAHAQPGARPAQPDEIVVTGKTRPPVETAKQFVRQVVGLNDGQLARFADPVCPEIIGLKPGVTKAIEDRFRSIAQDATVPLARGKCTPNLMIVFVTDADAFIKVMRKRHSSLFDDLADVDRNDAFRSGPIRSWRLLEMRDEVGHSAGLASDRDEPTTFETPARTVTVNAVLVMDKRAAPGKSIDQIADYAAMRTLVGARPPGKGAIVAASILSLFDPDVTPPPARMTTMDRSLLAGLYAMSDTVAADDARAQARDLSRRMSAGPGRR